MENMSRGMIRRALSNVGKLVGAKRIPGEPNAAEKYSRKNEFFVLISAQLCF